MFHSYDSSYNNGSENDLDTYVQFHHYTEAMKNTALTAVNYKYKYQ